MLLEEVVSYFVEDQLYASAYPIIRVTEKIDNKRLFVADQYVRQKTNVTNITAVEKVLAQFKLLGI